MPIVDKICIEYDLIIGRGSSRAAKEARDFGIKEWKLVLGLSVATGILSVLLILPAFPSPQATRILTCIVLLACGAINHCIVKLMIRAPRRSGSNETGTEQIQESI